MNEDDRLKQFQTQNPVLGQAGYEPQGPPPQQQPPQQPNFSPLATGGGGGGPQAQPQQPDFSPQATGGGGGGHQAPPPPSAQSAPPGQNVPNAGSQPLATSTAQITPTAPQGGGGEYTNMPVPSPFTPEQEAAHRAQIDQMIGKSPPQHTGGGEAPDGSQMQVPYGQQGMQQPPNWYDAMWGETQRAGDWLTPDLQNQFSSMINAGGGGNASVAGLPQHIRDSMRNATTTAEGWMQDPSRWDSQMVQDNLRHTYDEMDTRQDGDRLNLLRDSMNRLGPSSGQLSNEYIDLADQFNRSRTGFGLDVNREAANSHAADRQAAMQAMLGASGAESGSHWQHQNANVAAAGVNAQRFGHQMSGLNQWGNLVRGASNDRLGALERFGSVDTELNDRARDDYRWERDQEYKWADGNNRWQNDANTNAWRWAQFQNDAGGYTGGAPGGGGSYAPSGGGYGGGGGAPPGGYEDDRLRGYQSDDFGFGQGPDDYIYEGGYRP